MSRLWPASLLGFGVSVVLLAGCAMSSGPAKPGATSYSIGIQTPPVDTPLARCVDPSPVLPKPVDTVLARDFSGGGVQTAFALDGGAFRADPPPRRVVPLVSSAPALCNLLAGATAENFTVIGAASMHGMSFGLGVVTVADAILKTGPRTYLVGAQQRTASLQPYHARLAWLAVIKPDVIASCPAMTSTPRPVPPGQILPGYQILAIDADTGAAGILYTAKTNALCNFPGYRPASVAPAVEFISVPWTLVKRGPGTQSAAITYQPRPCDSRDLPTFARTGKPAAFADPGNPARVNIVLERMLTTCGPAAAVPLLLRSSDLQTDLPQHLIHAPVGAQDITQPG